MNTSASWHGPDPGSRQDKDPMGGILRRESRHMPVGAYLTLPNYAGDLSQPRLPEHHVVGHSPATGIHIEFLIYQKFYMDMIHLVARFIYV